MVTSGAATKLPARSLAVALWRSRHQTEVLPEGEPAGGAWRDFPRQDAHALAVHDLALARGPVERIGTHLGDRQRLPEGIGELDPVEEDDVVHERAHPEGTHDRRHPEELGILVVIERRDLVLLHERHHGMEEVAEAPARRPQA